MLKKLLRKSKLILLYVFLLLKRQKIKKRMNKTYFPTKWKTVGSLVEADIHSYLGHEGKGKHDPLELINLFGEKFAALKKQQNSYNLISVLLTIYIATYVFDADIIINIQAISLPREPIVLAVVILIDAFLKLYISLILARTQVIRHAIRGIITADTDPQLENILKSAFLGEEDLQFYRSKSNASLILVRYFSNILIITYVPAFFALLALYFINIYIDILGLMVIYQSIDGIFSTFFVLFVISVSLYVSWLLWIVVIYLPLRHKDWSTNDRFELNRQFNPRGVQELGDEVYGRLTANTFSLERLKRKLFTKNSSERGGSRN